MNRRHFLHTGLAAAGTFAAPRSAPAAAAEDAVAAAHAEIWKRFIDKHGVMIDFTALDGTVNLPTPDECRDGKPNALGWYQPIENGAMFNGLYMDAAVARWKHSKADADAAKARKLMEGLLLMASISDVKGFVGRGVSTDGKAHYAMGSDDQTLPWFLGLWRYLDSGLATKPERERIVAKLTETADAIVALKWALPAEPPFNRRGDFGGFIFDHAPRLLLVAKVLHAVTGDKKWDTLYRTALAERGGKDKLSRLEVCERGMVFWYAKTHNWTSCTCVGALRALWELETDAETKAAFAKGLQASADLAAKSLPLAAEYDPKDRSAFDNDWRTPMLPLWKPHKTEQEAQAIADLQVRAFGKVSPRRHKETAFVREPAAAAWIVSLAPDAKALRPRAEAVDAVLTRYDYSRMYYSTFFWVEAAWWRLAAVR